MLLLLVQLLHKFKLLAVALENVIELRIQVTLEALALQDALELLEKLQRVLDVADAVKTLVDLALSFPYALIVRGNVPCCTDKC